MLNEAGMLDEESDNFEEAAPTSESDNGEEELDDQGSEEDHEGIGSGDLSGDEVSKSGSSELHCCKSSQLFTCIPIL
jgi:hypothetical protein